MTGSDSAQPSGDAADTPATAPATPARTAAKPFVVPAAATVPIAERRTWEGYASDFRDLSEQLTALQQKLDTAQSERDGLAEQYALLQRQRHADRDRLASIIRAREALEANSAAQANRARIAQNAIALRDATIAALEAERQQSITDKAIVPPDQPAFPIERQELPSGDVRITTHTLPPSLLDRLLVALALRRARQAARGGYWAQAETLYQTVLMYRDDARIWIQLGHAQREQRAYADAAIAYREALARYPDNGEYHFMLGLAEAGQGNHAAAREAYHRARTLDARLVDIYGELRDPSLQA